ncbi:MAG: FHA domain-containing protein [Gemmataceae bacterium]|nr:FHA domain-containing protein [Gemmataceae bacterium]
MAITVTVDCAGENRTYPIEGTLTIGRAPENDVVLEAPSVSRRHATLRAEGGVVYFTDVGSANGSLINGQPATANQPVRLGPGDRVRIADTTLVLSGETETLVQPAAGQTLVEPGQPPTPADVPAPDLVMERPRTPARRQSPSPFAPGPSRAVPPLPVERQRGQPAAVPAAAAVVRARGPRGQLPATLVALAVVVMFVLFLGTNAVESKLLQADYYKGVLDHSDAYNRAYTEVARDPTLSGETNDLLGGVDVLPIELVDAVQTVVPTLLLQEIVEAGVDRLIAYLKHHSSLDLSLDVTEVVGGVGAGAVSLITEELIGLPTREADSYEEFKADMQRTLDGIKREGKLSDVVPDYEIPASKREEITSMIVTAGGLDPARGEDAKTIREIRAAVGDDDMEEAIKAGMGPLLKESTSGSRDSLVRGKYIREVNEGGETRYLLGPPPDVERDVSDALWTVYWTSWASGWLRPLSLALGAALLGLLAWLRYPDRVSMLRWTGAPLLVAGAIGFFGWLVGRSLARASILDATVGDGSGLPAAYDRLFRDIIDTALSDLTLTFWVPSLVAAVVGAGLIGLSFALARRLTHPGETPAPAAAGQ